MSPARSLFLRADENDGARLSKQNIIIIAVCSSFAAIFLAYFLFLAIRRCRRQSHPVPHPLPQPLAHHRQQHVTQIQQGVPRLATWYGPQLSAHHPVRTSSAGGSKSSLLGSDNSQALTPSSHPSIDTIRAPSDSSHQRLPIPSASFLNRPSSRSSLSSDASCLTSSARDHNPISPDSATPFFQRFPSQHSPMAPPGRRARPLSMSSTHTYGSSRTSRRGVPHAPHNQIQIILPTPLASTNNSRESLAMRNRYGSDAPERRSVADPWMNIGSSYSTASCSTESLPEVVDRTRNRGIRRHASAASNYPVVYEGETMPPVPPLNRGDYGANAKKLEKRQGGT